MVVSYALCQFDYGYSGTFYQESGGGQCLRFLNALGQPLNLIPPYGYKIINSNPTLPLWALTIIANATNGTL